MFPTLVPNSWVQDILLPQRGQQQGRGLQLHIVLGGFHNAFLLGLLQVLKNVDFYVPKKGLQSSREILWVLNGAACSTWPNVS